MIVETFEYVIENLDRHTWVAPFSIGRPRVPFGYTTYTLMFTAPAEDKLLYILHGIVCKIAKNHAQVYSMSWEQLSERYVVL